eukprot:CFRG0071T1
MPVVEELDLTAIRDAHPEYRFQALRVMKNDLIGSDQRKEHYIHAIPVLLDVLQNPNDTPECYVQAITALGSFAYGNEKTRHALVNECRRLVAALLGMLENKNNRVVEAAARTLKILYWSGIPRQQNDVQNKLASTQTPTQSSYQPQTQASSSSPCTSSVTSCANTDILLERQTLSLLIRLTSHSYGSIAESAAVIISKCCGTAAEQDAVAGAGGLKGLTNLLESKSPKTVDAALEALAAMTYDSACLCRQLLLGNVGIERKLVNFLREDRNSLRLLAATCLVNMDRMHTIPQLQNSVTMSLLPTLVKLCGDEDTHIRIRAPHILAYLVEESEVLEKAACEADVITKLIHSLATAKEDSVPEPLKSDLREAALSALASVCAKRESSRKQIIEARLLPAIVAELESPNVRVRSAACRCTRSLSRSVKTLRTALVDAGAAVPLFKLLSDDSPVVQAAACATLCNIVLDFSPMKQSMLDKGAVERLIDLTYSPVSELRLNSVWAIKNLLFQASMNVKEKVVAALGWQRIYELLNDDSIDIQQQTLICLRNLAFGGDLGGESAIDLVVRETGDALIPLLVEKMKDHAHPGLVEQAAYVCVNIATGSRNHKNLLMENSECLQCIKACLESPDAALKVVAAWCIINLTWKEDEGVEKRVRVIRAFGFGRVLRQLKDDPNFEVKGRTQVALEQLEQIPHEVEYHQFCPRL